MIVTAENFSRPASTARRRLLRLPPMDRVLLATVALLACLGLIMVYSASITMADRQLGQPYYFLLRQFVYVSAGAFFGWLVMRVPMQVWYRLGPPLLFAGFAMLVLVLIPGVGREVNGSSRWIPLGLVNLQVSEVVKLLVIMYLAGYLVRRNEEVRTAMSGFIKPMVVLSLTGGMLLLEPDFGATVVIMATALGMMLLAGMRIWHFSLVMAVVLAALAALAVISPYRLQRLTTFLDPWADPFNSGFQLTQALIAFGRGEWFGVGLGGSIQKLFYLPEAHTDFIFAVICEELGLVGAVAVIVLYSVLIFRALSIGRMAERAGQYFSAYFAYGLGLWVALQAYINMGVSMGVLPTKGLTLPLLSYGGSSVIVMCVAMGILQRVYIESGAAPAASGGKKP